MFRGVRRSAVKARLVSRETLSGDYISNNQNGISDTAMNNEIERLLEIYSENLGVNLHPVQQAALRAQLRTLIMQEQMGNGDSEVNDDSI